MPSFNSGSSFYIFDFAVHNGVTSASLGNIELKVGDILLFNFTKNRQNYGASLYLINKNDQQVSITFGSRFNQIYFNSTVTFKEHSDLVKVISIDSPTKITVDSVRYEPIFGLADDIRVIDEDGVHSGLSNRFCRIDHSHDINTNWIATMESGTYTPTVFLNFATVTEVEGHYTKVGKFVYCTGCVLLQGHTSTPSSTTLEISGLPFNIDSPSSDLHRIYCSVDVCINSAVNSNFKLLPSSNKISGNISISNSTFDVIYSVIYKIV